MKTIVFIHGNPGTTEDWSRVISCLKNKSILNLSIYDDDIINKINDLVTPVIIVTFSIGAYALLKNIKKINVKIEKLVLVAPYLISRSPLSGVLKSLLTTPILSQALVQLTKEKGQLKFLEEMVSPQKIKDDPSFEKILSTLKNSNLWNKTIDYKINFEENPLVLTEAIHIPTTVLFGKKDKISDSVEQKRFFNCFTNINYEWIEHAGHAIPWSHPSKISNLIEPKIGYHQGKSIHNNVIAYLESHLKKFPERIALRWVKRGAVESWDKISSLEHDQVSYYEFAQRITMFANGLRKIGIVEGDRVIIFLPMSLDMYVAMFAVQKIGAIAVFLDSWARSHHLGATAKCVKPKAMVSFKQAFELVDQVPEFKEMPIRILYGTEGSRTHLFSDLFIPGESITAPVESETTALITFTTGSTGIPKGANRTHRFLSAQHLALDHVIPYLSTDIDLPAFPIFSLNNLATGVTTVLPGLNLAAPSEDDPAILVNQFLNQKINCSTLSPSMLVGVTQFCLKNNIQLTNLKRLVTGGAPISRDDVEQFYKIAPQSELWILYGSTEAEPMAHIEGRDMLKEDKNKDPEIVEDGVNVGHMSEDIDYKFIKLIDGPIELDDQGWSSIEVGQGEVGEFICTGDHVCRDYYNNPNAFKATKILDQEGRVWHRTGDLGYLSSDSNLWLVGRVNNAIERMGKYYFPVKSEIILKRFDFTYRCAFLGIKELSLGNKTCVAIELKKEIKLDDFNFKSAKEQIQRVFSKNGIPVDLIYFVKSIPMDPRHHSKVEYNVLRTKIVDGGEIIA